ncbi:hypothetical protein MCOR01_007193 [Pyricularia oryzae]|nr:hypothetical protein MCOR01_007193 [Pyricularia oryzae]
MLPQTFLLVVAAARVASTLAIQSSQLSDLQPTPCTPSACGHNGSVVCYNDEQYCHAEADKPNYVGESLGLPCRNDTVSPKYPITKALRKASSRLMTRTRYPQSA